MSQHYKQTEKRDLCFPDVAPRCVTETAELCLPVTILTSGLGGTGSSFARR